MSNATIVNAISTAEVGYGKHDIRPLFLDEQRKNVVQTKVSLYRVSGIVTSIKQKRTVFTNQQTGEDIVQLKNQYFGNFKAMNLATGEMYQSTKLYLPDICEAIMGTIPKTLVDENAKGEKECTVPNVTFGIEVIAKYAEKSVTGYVYQCESLIPITNEIDAQLTALLGSPNPKQDLLPQPTESTVSVPTPDKKSKQDLLPQPTESTVSVPTPDKKSKK